MIYVYVFSGILLFLVVAFFLTEYIVYRKVFASKRFVPKSAREILVGEQYEPWYGYVDGNMKRLTERPSEKYTIKSFDGLTLSARYYHTADDAPVALMLHGYRSYSLLDGSAAVPDMITEGFNVLLPDQRAHGESGGKTISFGVNERKDALYWIQFILRKFGDGVKIVVVGVSMGASTALMASDEYPEQVKGVVADCGYTTPSDIIKKVMADMKLPVGLFFPLVKCAAKIYGKFDIYGASAPESLKKCKVPVAFIHGDDDRFVPYYMSEVNFEACASEKYFCTAKGAGHGIAYYINEQGYKETAAKVKKYAFE
ncbi:MAG: alpha/beta hydrolase [Clostridia bacterium]|nr:alpha/beta hydrolase [Clostridia bacterium]